MFKKLLFILAVFLIGIGCFSQKAYANTVCDPSIISFPSNTIQYYGRGSAYSPVDSDAYNIAFIIDLDCNNLGDLSPTFFEPFIADQDFWNGITEFYTPNPPEFFIRSVSNLLDGRYLVKVGSIEEVCFSDTNDYVSLELTIFGETRRNNIPPSYGRTQLLIPVQGFSDLYTEYFDFDSSSAKNRCLSPTPSFTLSKTTTAPTGTPGTPATFTLTLTNSGPGVTAGTYTVTDTLVSGLEFDTTGSDPRCSVAGQVVTCTDNAALALGVSTTFDIKVNIPNAGSYDNAASVSGGAAASVTSNMVTVVRTTPPSSGGDPTTIITTGGGCLPGSSCSVVPLVAPPTSVATLTPVVSPVLRKSTLNTLWKTDTATIDQCSTPLLTIPIKFGRENNTAGVRLLEQFLNTYEGENLTINGIYEQSDFDAVVRWQEKYTDAILKPWKLTKGTGYVYTTSLAQIARQYQARCSGIIENKTPVENLGTHIRIPAINLDRVVYTTGTLKQAKNNVWHSPETEMPDHGGNTVLVGHRYVNLVKDPTTGSVKRISPQPGVFFNLPDVSVGADIYVTQNEKEYHYKATKNFTVNPTDTWIEDETENPTLTLYTCTPLYTSKQRQVVRAELVKQ